MTTQRKRGPREAWSTQPLGRLGRRRPRLTVTGGNAEPRVLLASEWTNRLSTAPVNGRIIADLRSGTQADAIEAFAIGDR